MRGRSTNEVERIAGTVAPGSAVPATARRLMTGAHERPLGRTLGRERSCDLLVEPVTSCQCTGAEPAAERARSSWVRDIRASSGARR